MKRTVFEGTINGVKYDNVNEYNQAMVEALKSGQPVEASTNTKTIDTEDPQPESKPVEATIPEIDEDAEARMMMVAYPGFAHCLDGRNLDEAFLEANINVDPEKFSEDCKKLATTIIPKIINQMTSETLENYESDLSLIIEHLKEMKDERQKKKEALAQRIKQLQEQYDKNLAELALTDCVQNLYYDLKEVTDAIVDDRKQEAIPVKENDETYMPDGMCGWIKLAKEIFPDFTIVEEK